jgi:hypothetical protein
MPGYGFSGKPTRPGWGPERLGHAWAALMQRLGYRCYVAQGGDWGALVVDMMGVQTPPGLLGIHTNAERKKRLYCCSYVQYTHAICGALP